MPVGAGDRLARRPRVEPHERADLNRDLLTVDAVDPAAADDHVHFFLLRLALVVLAARRVRRELEPVDAERLDAENPPHEMHGAARPRAFDVVDVHR